MTTSNSPEALFLTPPSRKTPQKSSFFDFFQNHRVHHQLSVFCISTENSTLMRSTFQTLYPRCLFLDRNRPHVYCANSQPFNNLRLPSLKRFVVNRLTSSQPRTYGSSSTLQCALPFPSPPSFDLYSIMHHSIHRPDVITT